MSTLGPWLETAKAGSVEAMSGLSSMVGRDVEISSLRLSRVPAAEIEQLVGGQDATLVGVYLTTWGQARGHMMLIFTPEMASQIISLLSGETPDTLSPLGEMEASLLGEVGNMVGSFFVNSVADATGLSLRPSTPAVMVDMASVLLEMVAMDVLIRDEDAFVVEVQFSATDLSVDGRFFVVPGKELIRAMRQVKWG